jgi:NADH-quinone oxidoreductase subunit F
MSIGAHCDFGKHVGEFVINALEGHAEEFENHAFRKRCNASVCMKYTSYYILGSCTGCGKCAGVCEEEAIAGKKNFIHVISQTDCVKCGKCEKICTDSAVGRFGGAKPRVPNKPIPCGSLKV